MPPNHMFDREIDREAFFQHAKDLRAKLEKWPPRKLYEAYASQEMIDRAKAWRARQAAETSQDGEGGSRAAPDARD